MLFTSTEDGQKADVTKQDEKNNEEEEETGGNWIPVAVVTATCALWFGFKYLRG